MRTFPAILLASLAVAVRTDAGGGGHHFGGSHGGFRPAPFRGGSGYGGHGHGHVGYGAGYGYGGYGGYGHSYGYRPTSFVVEVGSYGGYGGRGGRGKGHGNGHGNGHGKGHGKGQGKGQGHGNGHGGGGYGKKKIVHVHHYHRAPVHQYHPIPVHTYPVPVYHGGYGAPAHHGAPAHFPQGRGVGGFRSHGPHPVGHGNIGSVLPASHPPVHHSGPPVHPQPFRQFHAPAHPQPVHPQPVHPQPIHPQPVHPQPIHPQPVHPQPVHQSHSQGSFHSQGPVIHSQGPVTISKGPAVNTHSSVSESLGPVTQSFSTSSHSAGPVSQSLGPVVQSDGGFQASKHSEPLPAVFSTNSNVDIPHAPAPLPLSTGEDSFDTSFPPNRQPVSSGHVVSTPAVTSSLSDPVELPQQSFDISAPLNDGLYSTPDRS